MCKEFPNARLLKPDNQEGIPMAVNGDIGDPIKINDIVEIKTDDDIVFQVCVEKLLDEYIEGKIVGKLPYLTTKYQNWSVDEKIKVCKSRIRAIIHQ